jgi:succinate dehydrogenase / fumarate reductase cytochrome b subunit
VETATSSSFLERNDFVIRRLFSLSGMIPVGAYMVIHLVANASVLNGPASYQNAVFQIRSLGVILPFVEWIFIFLPILFHAAIGLMVIRGGLPNSSSYPYVSNVRYTLQRATGMIAFLFILWHVFHMHGWIHAGWWKTNVAEPLGGGMFDWRHATSSVAVAMQSAVVRVLYAIGVLACVFHLANGLWTAGITWGVWTTPAAMRRANVVCAVFGVLLAFVAVGAWWGPVSMSPEDVERAETIEMKMLDARIAAGEMSEDEEGHSGITNERPSSAEGAKQ